MASGSTTQSYQSRSLQYVLIHNGLLVVEACLPSHSFERYISGSMHPGTVMFPFFTFFEVLLLPGSMFTAMVLLGSSVFGLHVILKENTLAI